MCVVSMIGDHYRDKYEPLRPYIYPEQKPFVINQGISKKEFDKLKQDVLEMKKLLQRALEYDKKNGEPNCEIDEKVELLKKVAELVGVDLSEIFSKNA